MLSRRLSNTDKLECLNRNLQTLEKVYEHSKSACFFFHNVERLVNIIPPTGEPLKHSRLEGERIPQAAVLYQMENIIKTASRRLEDK